VVQTWSVPAAGALVNLEARRTVSVSAVVTGVVTQGTRS
jgi:hypothetical protein